MARLAVCPDCRAEISPKATACPRCGRPMRRSGPRQYGCCSGILLIGFGLIVAAVVFSPGRSRDVAAPSAPPAAPRPTANVGDVIRLGAPGSPSAFVAADEAWDEFEEAVSARDLDGLNRLIVAGKVVKVPAGTEARVLRIGLDTRRVRIVGGDRDGFAGWINAGAVHP
jgi:hypothetical protein